jgi:hypothetical protein
VDVEERLEETDKSLRGLLSTRSFGLVLLGLVLSYVLAVSPIGRSGASIVLVVQIGTVLLALRASRAGRVVSTVASASMVLAAAAAGVNLFTGGATPIGLVFVASGLLYLVTPAAIVRSVIRSGRVDRQVVLGTIDAYIMIGMFFAFAYRALGVLLTGPFFGSGGEGTTAQTMFFSFTTLTTTGYGNLIPAETWGQSLSVAEMLAGQLFLVTALAKIIGAWRPERWGAGHGTDQPGTRRRRGAGQPPASGSPEASDAG